MTNIWNNIKRISRGIYGSFGDGVDRVNAADAQFARNGFGSFVHFAGLVLAGGILYGACSGGNGCSCANNNNNSSSRSSYSSGCASSYFGSGNVTTRGHLDIERFEVNGVGVEGLLRTNNPNRAYYLEGLNENRDAVEFAELNAKKLVVRKSDDNGQGLVNSNGQLLEPGLEYKIGCVDFGSPGKMCGLILPQKKDMKNIFCDPNSGQSYNSRIFRIPCYDRNNLDVMVDGRKGPRDIKLVALKDLRTYDQDLVLAPVMPPAPVVPVTNSVNRGYSAAKAGGGNAPVKPSVPVQSNRSDSADSSYAALQADGGSAVNIGNSADSKTDGGSDCKVKCPGSSGMLCCDGRDGGL